MSRKTKEEKKIAIYRKKQKLLQRMTKVESTVDLKQINKAPGDKTKEISESQLRHSDFIRDLKKSLLIIFLIITLEIIIYFVSIKDYLKLNL